MKNGLKWAVSELLLGAWGRCGLGSPVLPASAGGEGRDPRPPSALLHARAHSVSVNLDSRSHACAHCGRRQRARCFLLRE